MDGIFGPVEFFVPLRPCALAAAAVLHSCSIHSYDFLLSRLK